MLLTVDSEKVRGFSFKFGKKWIPLLVLREIYQGSVWIIGAREEEIYVVDLKGSTQTSSFPKTFLLRYINIRFQSFLNLKKLKEMFTER
jgi:hypothetical protein